MSEPCSNFKRDSAVEAVDVCICGFEKAVHVEALLEQEGVTLEEVPTKLEEYKIRRATLKPGSRPFLSCEESIRTLEEIMSLQGGVGPLVSPDPPRIAADPPQVAAADPPQAATVGPPQAATADPPRVATADPIVDPPHVATADPPQAATADPPQGATANPPQAADPPRVAAADPPVTGVADLVTGADTPVQVAAVVADLPADLPQVASQATPPHGAGPQAAVNPQLGAAGLPQLAVNPPQAAGSSQVDLPQVTANPPLSEPANSSVAEVVLHLASELEPEATPKYDVETKKDATEEKIEDEDAIPVPECCESILVRLFKHAEAVVRTLESESAPKEGLLPADVLSELYASLLKRRMLEQVSFEIMPFDDLKISFATRNLGQAKEVLASISQALTEIRPLDTLLTIKLSNATKKAAKLLKGRDVIFLLGDTGSGKSTTIQYLAGLKLVKTKVDGFTHIGPDPDCLKGCDPILLEIKSSPYPVSETNCIRAVNVRYANVGLGMEGVFTLCDSPGFGDTGGHAIEIANGIGIVDALTQANSVKPLAVISRLGNERLKGVIQLALTMSKLIQNLKDNLACVSYVFTKYEPDSGMEINQMLQYKLSHLPPESKTNIPLVMLLEDMIRKTKMGGDILDPLAGPPGPRISTLLNSPAIGSPADSFARFVSPDSLAVLRNQLEKMGGAVVRAIHRVDIPFLSYQMAQLKALAMHLQLNECTSQYEASRQELQGFIEARCKEAFAEFDNLLSKGGTLLQFQRSVELLHELIQFEPLRAAHFDDIANLQEQCTLRLKDVQRQLSRQVSVAISEHHWAEKATFELLTRMQFLEEAVKAVFVEGHLQNLPQSLSAMHNESRQVVVEKFKAQVQLACSAIENRVFPDYVCTVKVLTLAWANGASEVAMKEPALTDAFAQVNSHPYLLYKERVEKLLLQGDVKDAEPSARVLTGIGHLRLTVPVLADVHELQNMVVALDLREKLQSLILEVCNKCLVLADIAVPVVEGLLEAGTSTAFADIQQLFNDLNALLGIDQISVQVGPSSTALVKVVQTEMQKSKEQVMGYLQSPKPDNVKDFTIAINKIWLGVQTFAPSVLGPLETTLRESCEQVQRLLEQVIEELGAAKLSHPASPRAAVQIFSRYPALAMLAKVFPKVNETFQPALDAFVVNVGNVIDDVVLQLGVIPYSGVQIGLLVRHAVVLLDTCLSLRLESLSAKLAQLSSSIQHTLADSLNARRLDMEASLKFLQEVAVVEESKAGVVPIRFAQGFIVSDSVIPDSLQSLINKHSGSVVVEKYGEIHLLRMKPELFPIFSFSPTSIPQAAQCVVSCCEEFQDYLHFFAPAELKECHAMFSSFEEAQGALKECQKQLSNLQAKLKKDLDSSLTLEDLSCREQIATELKPFDELFSKSRIETYRLDPTTFSFVGLAPEIRGRIKELNLDFLARVREAVRSLDIPELRSCHTEAKNLGDKMMQFFSTQVEARLETEFARLKAFMDLNPSSITNLAAEFDALQGCKGAMALISPSVTLSDLQNELTSLVSGTLVAHLSAATELLNADEYEKVEQVLQAATRMSEKLPEKANLQETISNLRMGISNSLRISAFSSDCMLVRTMNRPTPENLGSYGVKDSAFVLVEVRPPPTIEVAWETEVPPPPLPKPGDAVEHETDSHPVPMEVEAVAPPSVISSIAPEPSVAKTEVKHDAVEPSAAKPEVKPSSITRGPSVAKIEIKPGSIVSPEAVTEPKSTFFHRGTKLFKSINPFKKTSAAGSVGTVVNEGSGRPRSTSSSETFEVPETSAIVSEGKDSTLPPVEEDEAPEIPFEDSSTYSLYYIKTSASLCIPIVVSDTRPICSLLRKFRDPCSTLNKTVLKTLEERAKFEHIDLDFAKVQLRPPAMLVPKVEAAARLNSMFYRPILTDFRANVTSALARFAQLGAKSEELGPMFSQAVTKALSFCPLDWHGAIKNDCDRLELSIKEKEANRLKALETLRVTENFVHLQESMAKYIREGSTWYAAEARRRIEDLILGEIKVYERELTKGLNIASLEGLSFAMDQLLCHSDAITRERNWWWRRYYACDNKFLEDQMRNRVLVPFKQYLGKALLGLTIDSASTAVQGLELFEKYASLRTSRLNEIMSIHYLKQTKITDALKELGQQLLTLQAELTKEIGAAVPDLKKVDAGLNKVRELDSVIKVARECKNLKTLSAPFAEAVRGLLTYQAWQERLIKLLLQWKQKVLTPLSGNKELQTPNANDRDEFFKALYSRYLPLLCTDVLTSHVDKHLADLQKAAEECKKHLEKEIAQLAKDCMECKYVQYLSGDEDDTTARYASLSSTYDNFRAVQAHFPDKKIVACAERHMQAVAHWLTEILDRAEKGMAHEKDTYLRTCYLIGFKAFALQAPVFSDQVNERIERILSTMIKSSQSGSYTVMAIGEELKKHKLKPIALSLINNHSSFSAMAILLRNQKTLQLGIEYVAEALERDSLCTKNLKTLHKEFDTEYWNLVSEGLGMENAAALEKISSNSLPLADKIKKMDPSPKRTQGILSLLAHLFAYWTLEHATDYRMQSKKLTTDNRKYLLQPHAAQVVAILRLLGLDTEGHIENHLIEILTGEGKSVILAITAALLALLGFHVDCACYSEYLSMRDREAFQSLFVGFGVQARIEYGTFSKLCEKFINDEGDLREMVTALLVGKAQTSAHKASSGARILLIDEVDVFFSKDFYGNEYHPLTSIRDATISELIKYVASLEPRDLNLSKIQETTQYRACCDRFPSLKMQFPVGATELKSCLIDEALKSLINAVLTFPSHEALYVIINGRIGYKEQDGISCQVSYGYHTMLAYLKEWKEGRIDYDSMEKSLCLSLDSGSFSYAEVPKLYEHILGVTGTLRCLADTQKAVLRDEYGISKQTFVPSVYGKNKRIFVAETTEGVTIVPEPLFFITIAEAIKLTIGTNKKRSVLVFFENKEILQRFLSSNPMADLKGFAKVMTEEMLAHDKKGLINSAATPENVTLLTREFGRGTDFVCYDEGLDYRGGVHVIQTFASDNISEETQIMGRTSRQGNNGSYGMILLDTSLEKYDLHREDIERMTKTSTMYSTLTAKRQAYFDLQFPLSLLGISAIKEKHQKSMNFVTSLQNSLGGDETTKKKAGDAVQAFLLNSNLGPEVEHAVIRTICLMDATGSMSSLLTKAQNSVADMFDRVEIILKKKKISARFEIQFVCFRNYDCKLEQLLQVSDWESRPDNLRKFMREVTAHGGTHWQEAVEIALEHANNEASKCKITQVLLIGDAAPNTPEQVEAGRARFGEDYWEQTPFSEPTLASDEADILREKGVPVYAFYVIPQAKSAFEEIAEATGGKARFLDVNSDKGAEDLTDVVVARVLDKIGGESLVKAYCDRFSKGYIDI